MRVALIGSQNNPHVRRWAGVLVESGVTVALVAPKPPAKEIPGVELLIPRWTTPLNLLAFGLLRNRRSGEFFAPYAIRPVLRPWKPDIVHGFDALFNGYKTVASACGAKTVVEPFGSDIFAGWKQGWRERWLVKTALKRADAVTCNFPNIARHAEQTLGVQLKKADGFSWGVDTAVFHPDGANNRIELRRKLNVPNDAKVIFSPRGMRAYMGMDYLGAGVSLDAFAEVATERNDLHLLVLAARADASVYNPWKEKLSRLDESIKRRVHILTERQTQTEMADLYRASDLFLSVPRTDLLSLCVIEGIACGAYGIAGGCPDFKDVLIKEDDLKLSVVNPLDTNSIATGIREGLAAIDSVPIFAQHNFAIIQRRHNWNQQKGKLLELYESLLQPE